MEGFFECLARLIRFALLKEEGAHQQWNLRIPWKRFGQPRVNSERLVQMVAKPIGIREEQVRFNEAGALSNEIVEHCDGGARIAFTGMDIGQQ